MKITNEILEQKFNEYNNLYFNGKLPKRTKLTVVKGNYTTMSGFFSYEIKSKRLCSPKFGIVNSVNWTEYTLKGTLLHEMIHLYLTDKYKKDMGHGMEFQKMCKQFKKEYNIQIIQRCDGIDFKTKRKQTIIDLLSEKIVKSYFKTLYLIS